VWPEARAAGALVAPYPTGGVKSSGKNWLWPVRVGRSTRPRRTVSLVRLGWVRGRHTKQPNGDHPRPLFRIRSRPPPLGPFGLRPLAHYIPLLSCRETPAEIVIRRRATPPPVRQSGQPPGGTPARSRYAPRTPPNTGHPLSPPPRAGPYGLFQSPFAHERKRGHLLPFDICLTHSAPTRPEFLPRPPVSPHSLARQTFLRLMRNTREKAPSNIPGASPGWRLFTVIPPLTSPL